jgi:hypothetical protein
MAIGIVKPLGGTVKHGYPVEIQDIQTPGQCANHSSVPCLGCLGQGLEYRTVQVETCVFEL